MSEAANLEETTRPVLERTLRFKERLRAGEVAFGAWMTLTDPAVAEIMADLGFDYILFDTEHSPWNMEALQTAIMAFRGSETVPMARVPWNDPVTIKRYLDCGIEGILAPMVRTPEEARALVAACRYPPDGKRGFGPRRASNYYRDLKAYVGRANDAIFVMPQIEDIKTVDVLDAFMSVPGLDGICLGPNDLSGTAGHLGNLDHPEVKGALDKIIAAAKSRNLPVCLGITTPVEQQKALIEQGVRLMLVTADLELLIGGGKAALDSARHA
ncbi:MAG: HpcH/HpaI aldolase family protein [Geminicoccales bacterium]